MSGRIFPACDLEEIRREPPKTSGLDCIPHLKNLGSTRIFVNDAAERHSDYRGVIMEVFEKLFMVGMAGHMQANKKPGIVLHFVFLVRMACCSELVGPALNLFLFSL